MIKSLAFPNYDASATITMYGDPAALTPDTNGVRWGLFDIDGWNDDLDVRAAVFERPFQDGAVLSPFSYAARVIELHGGLSAPTVDAGIAAVRTLKEAFQVKSSAFADGLKRLSVIDMDTGSIVRFLDVRRTAQSKIKPFNFGKAYEFSIPLLAPDPRKYDSTQKTAFTVGNPPAAVSCVDAGDLPGSVTITVTGPVTNPHVTHDRTGWSMQFSGALTAGQTVTFVTGDHTVSGGVLTRANVNASSKWFPILPGTNTFTLSGTGMSGATRIDVFWRDAYS